MEFVRVFTSRFGEQPMRVHDVTPKVFDIEIAKLQRQTISRSCGQGSREFEQMLQARGGE